MVLLHFILWLLLVLRPCKKSVKVSGVRLSVKGSHWEIKVRVQNWQSVLVLVHFYMLSPWPFLFFFSSSSSLNTGALMASWRSRRKSSDMFRLNADLIPFVRSCPCWPSPTFVCLVFWYLLLAQLIRVALITSYRHVGQNAGKKDDKEREKAIFFLQNIS